MSFKKKKQCDKTIKRGGPGERGQPDRGQCERFSQTTGTKPASIRSAAGEPAARKKEGRDLNPAPLKSISMACRGKFFARASASECHFGCPTLAGPLEQVTQQPRPSLAGRYVTGVSVVRELSKAKSLASRCGCASLTSRSGRSECAIDALCAPRK